MLKTITHILQKKKSADRSANKIVGPLRMTADPVGIFTACFEAI